MKLYLVRHAKTIDAAKNLTPNDDTSIVIDEETKSRIATAKTKIGHADIIYSSPLKRARQTADLLFGQDGYEVIDYIYEYKEPLETIGKPREILSHYWGVEHRFDKLDIHWTPDGGESFITVAKRARRLYNHLQKVKREEHLEKVVVISHGTFLRHLLLRTTGIPWTRYPKLFFGAMKLLRWDPLQVIELEI